MEDDDDVVGLLSLIKNLAYATVNVQYPYWVAAEQWKKMALTKQGTNEALASFYKRWKAGMDVLESQYRQMVPAKLVDPNTGKDASLQLKTEDDAEEQLTSNLQKAADEASHKLKACLFLMAVDNRKYDGITEELNNQYLHGSRPYPVNVEGVVSMLTHRITPHNNNNNQRNTDKQQQDSKTNEDEKEEDEKMFSQSKRRSDQFWALDPNDTTDKKMSEAEQGLYELFGRYAKK